VAPKKRLAKAPSAKSSRPAKAPRPGPRSPASSGVKAPPEAAAAEVFPTLLGPFDPVPLRPPGATRADPESVKWLQRAAMQWSHIARNRRRWAGVPSLARDQAERARALAAACGFDDRKLIELARARVVQVAVPFVDTEIGWESRIFPWEFLLSSATQELRGGSPLTVLRQLKRKDSPKAPPDEVPAKAPAKVLYVECAPGNLQTLYSFASERTLVSASLRAGPQPVETQQERDWIVLENPTPDRLRKTILDDRPEIVHLAGFDTHQGYQLLGRGADSELDGVLMREDDVKAGFVAVSPEQLASILTANGAHKPLLISCSFWNSAARVAALLVAYGARAAIAFQDTFDDALVEMFFAAFYRRYRAAGWNLRDAFVSAWERVRQQPVGLQGTGLVLWSEAPLVGPEEAKAPRTEARELSLATALEAESTVVDPATVRPEDVDKYVRVQVDAISEMNYSLLHNRQPLFKLFKILSLTPRRLIGIDVKVHLSAGDASATYRRTIDLKEGKADLTDRILVPLTAPLLRGVRETVNSSLLVEVTWGPHTLMRETSRVQLLPADQWCFADRDQSFTWLPSFVFPRDRAIGTLLEKAQRYVRVLRDDPTTGFEGYQAIDADRDDPTEDVDLQVQAIWSAIVHEWQLVYTNPPPTYSRRLDSQRLRTPTTILRDRFGTCIDTSLLIASCLELIGVYPVIVLLDDHAFPGYWRSDEAHDRFHEMSTAWVAQMTVADHRGAVASETPTQGWVLARGAYDEILRQVDEGNLVPIESTMLTENAGFWAAVEAARENFVPKSKFHSMLDIANARTAGVTPLPIWEAQS
jgi:hypothetical protein